MIAEQLHTPEDQPADQSITVHLAEPRLPDIHGAAQWKLNEAWEQKQQAASEQGLSLRPGGVWFDQADFNQDYAWVSPDGETSGKVTRLFNHGSQLGMLKQAVLEGKLKTTSKDQPGALATETKQGALYFDLRRSDNATAIAEQVSFESRLHALGTWFVHGQDEATILCWYDNRGIHIGPNTIASRQALRDAGLEETKVESQKPLAQFRPPVGSVPTTRAGEVEPEWIKACEYWASMEAGNTRVIADVAGPVATAATFELPASTMLLPVQAHEATQVIDAQQAALHPTLTEAAREHRKNYGEYPTDLRDWDPLFRPDSSQL